MCIQRCKVHLKSDLTFGELLFHDLHVCLFIKSISLLTTRCHDIELSTFLNLQLVFFFIIVLFWVEVWFTLICMGGGGSGITGLLLKFDALEEEFVVNVITVDDEDSKVG